MSLPAWHSRPLFVTSTFADMQAERDYLRDFVFPELAERLRERCHHFEPIDLRWGVDTVSLDEEEARESLVLKVCLAEIRRSQPFLIGLIGDRYGWVPTHDPKLAAVNEQGFITDVRGKSVTALEIEFGVFSALGVRPRCHFYLRAPLPYDKMPPEVAERYSDDYSTVPGAREAASRLTDLKRRLRETPALANRVHVYHANWNSECHSVTGLENWGRQVLDHVWRDLAEECFGPALAPASVEDEDSWSLETFVEDRARHFVGRSKITTELLHHARSASWETLRWGICVTGESGSGKSALFAHLHRELANYDDLVLLSHAAGVGSHGSMIDFMLRRWARNLAKTVGEEPTIHHQSPFDEVEQMFHSYLARAGQSHRIVMLIDALNEFESTPMGQHLTWLPKLLPDNLRLIATAAYGVQSCSLVSRPGVRELPLLPLTVDDASLIAERLCEKHHRTLNSAVLAKVLERETNGKISAGNPLWLELALDELHLLDADDFARAEREYRGSYHERLQQMMEDVAGRLPADIDGLYTRMLARAEQLFGVGWARGFANLLAIGRHGWRESDLQSLLPGASTMASAYGTPEGEAPVSTEWNDLRFATLRRSFRAQLTQHGIHRQWDLSHAHARAAIRRRNVNQSSFEQSLHALIAQHLISLPARDELRTNELMTHLLGWGNRKEASLYYAGTLEAAESYTATQSIASFIASDSNSPTNPSLEWAISLLDESLNDSMRMTLCNRYVFELYGDLRGMVDISTCARLIQAVLRHADQLVQTNPCAAEFQETLMESYALFAGIRADQGMLDESIEAYRRAAEIANEGQRRWQERRLWQSSLASVHERIGKLSLMKGDLGASQAAFGEAVAVARNRIVSQPNEVAGQLQLSDILDGIGALRMKQGQLGEAAKSYEAAFAICQQLAELMPHDGPVHSDLSHRFVSLGDLYAAKEDLKKSLECYREAATIRQILVDQDPGNPALQRKLAAALNRLGVSLSSHNRPREALDQLMSCCQIAERLANADPSNAVYQRDLAVAYFQLANVHHQLDDQSVACDEYWADCYRVLSAMRDAGMALDEHLQVLLEAGDER